MSPEHVRRLGRVASSVLGVAVVALVVVGGAWRVTGGCWRIVETPSMGAAAPVGTLLWVRPVARADIHVGTIITFHPPTEPDATFTHRVVAVHPAGYTTKGDINGSADAWTVPYRDVVGRVALRWWIAGWVVKAAPILLGGGVLLSVLTRWYCSRRWRVPVRILGAGLLVSLSIYVVRPLLRAAMMSYVASGTRARAVLVDTGILPVRISASGHHVDVRSGHVASLLVGPGPGGRLALHVGPDVPWIWILVAVLVVLTPALVSLCFPSPVPSDDEG
jgi:signal peptidase I